MDRFLKVIAGITLLLVIVPASPAAEIKLLKKYDLTYSQIDGQKLQLDVAMPSGTGPFPCVVCFHGGAWKAGSRKELSRPAPPWLDMGVGQGSLIESIANRGYVAVSVSYRLAPKAKFPAQIQDAKTAIRYLRQNAKELKLVPDNIGAMGFSAGGHIVCLLGTTSNISEFDGTDFLEQSSQVKCVVNFFGPADLTLFCETPGIEAGFMVPLLGCKSIDNLGKYMRASPLNHVSKDDPPFLHIHGSADFIVPLIHSERLHKRMQEVGVSSELIVASGKGHGWFGKDAAKSNETAIRFLDQHLKPKP